MELFTEKNFESEPDFMKQETLKGKKGLYLLTYVSAFGKAQQYISADNKPDAFISFYQWLNRLKIKVREVEILNIRKVEK